MAMRVLAAAAILFFGSWILLAQQVITPDVHRIFSWASFGLAGLVVLWSLFRLVAGGVSRLFLAMLIFAGILIALPALFFATFPKC